MLTVTFAAAKRAQACAEGYKKMRRAKGIAWRMDRPIPLLEVLDELGLDDTLWALRIAEPVAERDMVSRLLACDCAERVLPLFTAQYPGDQRPRQAIEVARRYARGRATRDELDATSDAARDAAGAAWVAAESAESAESAAWAARAAAGAGAAWVAAESAESAESAARAAGAAEAADAADAADAAWAARAAERQWQAARLRQYLTGEVKPCA